MVNGIAVPSLIYPGLNQTPHPNSNAPSLQLLNFLRREGILTRLQGINPVLPLFFPVIRVSRFYNCLKIRDRSWFITRPNQPISKGELYTKLIDLIPTGEGGFIPNLSI